MQLKSGEVYIHNSLVDIHRVGQINNLPPNQSADWVLGASLDYLGQLPLGTRLNYTLDDGNITILRGTFSEVTANESTITGNTLIPDNAVFLWWPAGLGPQRLYDLRIDLVGCQGPVVASVTKRIGFRTIVLNAGPITSQQRSQGIAPETTGILKSMVTNFTQKGSSKH